MTREVLYPTVYQPVDRPYLDRIIRGEVCLAFLFMEPTGAFGRGDALRFWADDGRAVDVDVLHTTRVAFHGTHMTTDDGRMVYAGAPETPGWSCWDFERAWLEAVGHDGDFMDMLEFLEERAAREAGTAGTASWRNRDRDPLRALAVRWDPERVMDGRLQWTRNCATAAMNGLIDEPRGPRFVWANELLHRPVSGPPLPSRGETRTVGQMEQGGLVGLYDLVRPLTPADALRRVAVSDQPAGERELADPPALGPTA